MTPSSPHTPPAARALLASLAVVVVSGLAYGCGLQELLRSPGNEAKTRSSLTMIDTYPLYVMRYYGDYGFGDFLKRGISRSGAWHLDESSGPSWACTCFGALAKGGDVLLGRNFDWSHEATMLLFTDPSDGYASVSMVHGNWISEQPLQAPYWPFDGMNERGLAAGIMAVPDSTLPHDSAKVTIGSLHAIRLLLDRAADVEEGVALLQKYNIDFRGGPVVHYLLVDKGGHAALVEYVDGEVQVFRNDEPWQVATNFLVAREHPQGVEAPCNRYREAYQALQRGGGRLSREEAMALLGRVSQSNTVWSAVYDVTNGEVRLAMGRRTDAIYTFNLNKPPITLGR